MENKTSLAELAMEIADVEVDGQRAEALEPRYKGITKNYATADAIAREAGISVDSPRYSGMHHHCQYQRTC